MSISNEQNLRCIVFALIPICADFAIAVAVCRTRPLVETLSIRENSLSYCSIKEVCAPSHSDKFESRLYCCLKDEKKGVRTILGLSPVSLQSDWKDSSFHLMVKCPTKSATSLVVLKGLKFRFSPTIFGALRLLFECFLSFYRTQNSANTIFWAEVAYRYRISLNQKVVEILFTTKEALFGIVFVPAQNLSGFPIA